MKNVPHDIEATHEGPRAVLQAAGTLTRQAHPEWIYFLPILHFCACLMSTLRYFVPGLQYLIVIWEFVMHADFPVSLARVRADAKVRPARRNLDRRSRNAVVVPAEPRSGGSVQPIQRSPTTSFELIRSNAIESN